MHGPCFANLSCADGHLGHLHVLAAVSICTWVHVYLSRLHVLAAVSLCVCVHVYLSEALLRPLAVRAPQWDCWMWVAFLTC